MLSLLTYLFWKNKILALSFILNLKYLRSFSCWKLKKEYRMTDYDVAKLLSGLYIIQCAILNYKIKVPLEDVIENNIVK